MCVLKPTAGQMRGQHLAACALVFPNRVDDERKHRRGTATQGITRMARRANLHPKLHRHNRLAQWPGGHVARGARPASSSPLFQGPAVRPGDVGLGIWPGRMLSWQRSFKRSGAARLLNKIYALSLGEQPLGWSKLGGGTRRRFPGSRVPARGMKQRRSTGNTGWLATVSFNTLMAMDGRVDARVGGRLSEAFHVVEDALGTRLTVGRCQHASVQICWHRAPGVVELEEGIAFCHFSSQALNQIPRCRQYLIGQLRQPAWIKSPLSCLLRGSTVGLTPVIATNEIVR